MQTLSEGWSNLDKTTRRTSPEYVLRANRLTSTSKRVAAIRTTLIDLAVHAQVWPPLRRSEIRQGKRVEEIIEKIGLEALHLLDEHGTARTVNLDAMADLRAEDGRISREIGSTAIPMQVGVQICV